MEDIVGLKSSYASDSLMVEYLNCLKLSMELNEKLPQSVFPAVSQVKTQCYSLERAETGPVKSRGISPVPAAGLQLTESNSALQGEWSWTDLIVSLSDVFLKSQ